MNKNEVNKKDSTGLKPFKKYERILSGECAKANVSTCSRFYMALGFLSRKGGHFNMKWIYCEGQEWIMLKIIRHSTIEECQNFFKDRTSLLEVIEKGKTS